MKFRGYIHRDKETSMWAIGCDDLAAATQGTTRQEAFRMFAAYFEDLFEKPIAAEIRVTKESGKEFEFEFSAEKELFFDLLKQLKIGAAMKNKQIAERVGVKEEGSISRYMTGAREPSATTFLSLLDAMGYELTVSKKEAC